MLNARDTLRDVLDGIGVPAEWVRDDDEMDEIERRQREQESAQAAMAQVGTAAAVAKDLGSAAKDFAQAGAISQSAPVPGATTSVI